MRRHIIDGKGRPVLQDREKPGCHVAGEAATAINDGLTVHPRGLRTACTAYTDATGRLKPWYLPTGVIHSNKYG